MAADLVTRIKLDDKQFNDNIRNGTYPIIAKFYAIYRKDNKNENIPVLIDWILSNEGQEIIEKTGYVSIN